MRLSHLTAVAVMIALVGAMFVAMGSVRAQTNGISIGSCLEWVAPTATTTANQSTMNYVAVGDSCAIDVVANERIHSTNTSVVASSPKQTTDNATFPLVAGSVGVTEITVIPVTTANNVDTDGAVAHTYRITVIPEPTLVVNIADSDNIVSNKAPARATAMTVTARGVELERLPLTSNTSLTVKSVGLYFLGAGTTTSFLSAVNEATDTRTPSDGHAGQRQFDVSSTLSIAGVTNGSYTITASIPAVEDTTVGDNDDEIDQSREAVTGEATLTISDPGSSPASATLALGNSKTASPFDPDSVTVAESGSTVATGDINLVWQINNSLGNAANSWELTTVQVVAPNAVVTPSELSGPKGQITVRSANNRARAVTVYLFATGSGGVAESDKITLTFTGGANTLSLGEPSSNLLNQMSADDDRDEITFSFGTTDSSGSSVDNPTNLHYAIAGPDGKSVSTKSAIIPMQETGQTSAPESNDVIKLTANASPLKPLAGGEYTLKVTSGALSTTADFVVVGKADTVAITTNEADENGQIDVTVEVTDAMGNHVADGTPVMIESADLRGDNDRVLYRTSTTGKTKVGMAAATFIEIGPGRAAIIATADGKTDVARVTSNYGAEDEAMPEPEPEMASAKCLSELSGFSTWTCGVDADVSEIFNMVSERDVTAIHLWNGSTWVRYSVVDGAMVPGSSDFMVTENDILYISN